MNRFAVLVVFAVLILASCAKREQPQESPAPPPPPPVASGVQQVEAPALSKLKGLAIQKPVVNHVPGKDPAPAPASASAAPSAK